MSRLIDLTGMRFERLSVLYRDGTYISQHGNTEPLWKCRCDCGKEISVRGSMLRTGKQKSCGCYSAEKSRMRLLKHGFSDAERLYGIWNNMRNRCSNPNSPRYELYGGRGITVCDEWSDYSIFREWAISHGYKNNLSIDRIKTDEWYRPDNCRWVTQKIQCNNKRSNRYLTFNGETKTMMEWSECVDIPYSTIRSRLNSLGWTVEHALSAPVRRAV